MNMKIIVITSFFILLSIGLIQAQKAPSTSDLKGIDRAIAASEAQVEGLKPNNEAKIIWASQHEHQKTPIAFVYLHGFGASNREGEPVMSKLSEKYNANVYLSRLKEHGIQRKNNFEYLTPENYIASAKEAIAIGKLIGKKVILVSTSTGGTLSLALAAEDKDIAGLILYSPFIGLINPQMETIITPEGKENFIKMLGGEIQEIQRPEEEAKYWSSSFHVNGYVSLITMLKKTMTPATFSKVKCPVFVGYYYKNEEEQDKVVSVPGILKMYEQLGTPEKNKMKVAFPDAGNHVIACDLRSNDWENVYTKTTEFIDSIIFK
jgi:esterase/lipase